MAFDYSKTKAAIFRWKKTTPTAIMTVGNNIVPFNKDPPRWLGIWLDFQLMLQEHHATRFKDGCNAMVWMKWLAWQLVLSSENCRKVMTACIQSVAMFGVELWWEGTEKQDTIGRVNELQLLVNRQTRATTGCFRTTNLGVLSMESGL